MYSHQDVIDILTKAIKKLRKELSEIKEKNEILQKENEVLLDASADYGHEMLKRFDASSAESTDLYTYICSLLAKIKRLEK